MGNQPSAQAVNSFDAERAKLESLSQPNLPLFESTFNELLKGRSSGPTEGGDSAKTVLHADLKALFGLPVPHGSSKPAQTAVESLNAHIVTGLFGEAPSGVTYPAFLSGLARCGKMGSKKEQIEQLFRCFIGSSLREEQSEVGERVRSSGGATASAPSEDAAFHSNERGGMAISNEQLEGILLAVWCLTAWIRQRRISHDNGEMSLSDSSPHADSGNVTTKETQWPDLHPLVNGALEYDAAGKGVTNEEIKDQSSKQGLTFEQTVSWAVATLPGLSDVLELFLVGQCCRYLDRRKEAGKEGNEETVKTSSADSGDGNSEMKADPTEGKEKSWKPGMLIPGVAWSMGLSLSFGTAKWGVGPRLTDLGCGGGDLTRLVGRPRLLYRSSEHGRGMNRMMSHVEGYSGTVLVVIAACPLTSGASWSIGALLPDGLDNKRTFFGSPNSCLFALKPAFKVFRASGRDPNFVYCHARIAGQGYQSHPLPEGFGLGGTMGKERVWLDDNATPGKVTVRHHAVDKTFQPGALVPDLGYGGVDARVEDVEVWGLGGQQADSKQRAYLEREQRFQEQRRKIDMKKFAEGWQDSPDRLILEWGGART